MPFDHAVSQFLKDFPDLPAGSSVAVGVSGGPDSMALCWLLSRWALHHNVTVHAITVDHALRAESAQEAKDVAHIVRDWPNVVHTTLTWEGQKPGTRILEEARAARYDLLHRYMKQNGIRHLFIAHHQDDQAETFLIRLAKGSGLDGLGGMQKIRQGEDGTYLCRPLLDVSKDDLIALCNAQSIPFVTDPTNRNEKYLRPRLRAARDILEEEGMSSKRLAVTAARLSRARAALETLAQDLFHRTVRQETPEGFTFDWTMLKQHPEELILRVLLMAVHRLKPEDDYAPRMERMEALLSRLLGEDGFKSATLSGCLFALHPKNGTLRISLE